MDEFNSLTMLDADDDWNRARRKLLYQKVVCFLRRCSVDLLSFEDVRSRLGLDQKFDRGLQMIPLDQIRGSVGRYDDFAAAFLPRKRHMRQRWERVDAIIRAGNMSPIELYKVGESYFVLDGNHRVSVARQLGFETIEAYVCDFPTPFGLSQEADIDELLIKSDRAEFLETICREGPQAMREIVFTCPGSYSDLVEMIGTYCQSLENGDEHPVSTESAISAWYEEVYSPCIEIIQKTNLLTNFTNRTEADLFIWAWKNNKHLEELVLEEENPPANDHR